MKLVDLKDHKDRKKLIIIVDDLTKIVNVMDLSIKGLKFFGKYVHVMECISCLQNNKTLLEIKLNKYKRTLETKDENKLEKSEE